MNEPITPANAVEKAKALLGAATSGPWQWGKDSTVGDWGHHGPDLETVASKEYSCGNYCVWLDDSGVEQRGTGPEHPHTHSAPVATIITSTGYDFDQVIVNNPADADLIAASPQLVQALVARVEQLKTENVHFQHEAESWRQAWGETQDEYRESQKDGLVLAKATEDLHEVFENLVTSARQLERQRDAAVDTLQSIKAVIAAVQDGLMDEGIACIDAAKLADVALAALGAEEAK